MQRYLDFSNENMMRGTRETENYALTETGRSIFKVW